MGEHSLPDPAEGQDQTTQSQYPWRAVIRTVFALIVGFAPMIPLIVDAAGLTAATPGVGAALAVSATVTRVLADPRVDLFLRRWVPWLAAAPRLG